MRIVTGKLKGKNLKLLDKTNIRPLKDRAREGIFNILSHSNKVSFDFKNSNILDLFSGTGSFGLECLSRGAKKVYFIEKNAKAIDNLKINIENLNVEKNTIDHFSDVIYFLSKKKPFGLKFNLIFCDPPFKEKLINKIIELIYDQKLVTKNNIFILHRNKKSREILPNYFDLIDERSYGVSKIIIGRLNI